MKKIFDLLIIGAGPAGLTAGIYARRFELNAFIIGSLVGGLASEAHKICNFPTDEEISGFDLVKKMQGHTFNLGVKINQGKVVSLKKQNSLFKCSTHSGKEFYGKTLLLALGTKRQKLNLPNEKKFLGRGVSYCATCDGPLFKDKTLVVVGGANAAVTAALYLSEIAQKVFLIYRKEKLRAEPAWVKQIEKRKNLEVIFNTNVIGLFGEENLEKVKLDSPYKGSEYLDVEGLFVEIGSVPEKILSQQLGVTMNEKGFIKIDEAGRTNIKGIWAAGDITTGSNSFRQIITACSEGAIAAESIFKSFQNNV